MKKCSVLNHTVRIPEFAHVGFVLVLGHLVVLTIKRVMW